MSVRASARVSECFGSPSGVFVSLSVWIFLGWSGGQLLAAGRTGKIRCGASWRVPGAAATCAAGVSGKGLRSATTPRAGIDLCALPLGRCKWACIHKIRM